MDLSLNINLGSQGANGYITKLIQDDGRNVGIEPVANPASWSLFYDTGIIGASTVYTLYFSPDYPPTTPTAPTQFQTALYYGQVDISLQWVNASMAGTVSYCLQAIKGYTLNTIIPLMGPAAPSAFLFQGNLWDTFRTSRDILFDFLALQIVTAAASQARAQVNVVFNGLRLMSV